MATKDVEPVGVEEVELKEANVEDYLHVVWGAQDVSVEVDFHIAIVGEVGSGRSAFVNAIRGMKEDDENAARPEERKDSTPKMKRFLSYFLPEKGNIHFCILPTIDDETSSSKSYLEDVKVEMYDVFLMFTSASCHEQLLSLAKRIHNHNKPVFFVQIFKGDAKTGSPCLKKETGFEVYLIDVHQEHEHDFYKLTKAIANVLPSPKKKCFNEIPKIGELSGMHHFKEFVKEKEAKKIILSGTDIKQKLVSGGIMGVQDMIGERLKRWENVKINLAILGDSGVGKSSFINAIRGLRSSHPFGAKTGSTETTNVPLSYQHPTNPNILFWDLPGIGTPNHPDVIKFCAEFRIEIFDTFLIIASTRFTEFHRKFAEEVASIGKSFFFVRSKIDDAIRNEKRDNDLEEKETIEKVTKDCVERLKGTNFSEENIFLISNHHTDKWDFNRLKISIFEKLPFEMKKSFIFSLQTSSEDILRTKIEVLKERTWLASVASVATKLSLGPLSFSIDKQRIKSKINFYRLQLGFPETDSEEFQNLPEELQKRVEMFDLKRVKEKSGQDFLEWMKFFDSCNKYNIRISGPCIFSRKPFHFVELFLDQVLDEMGSTAQKIIAKRLQIDRENDDC